MTRPAAGRGLVEFVAGATVAAALLAGAWTLYLQNERQHRPESPRAAAEAALRAALAALEPDLRMAGALGLTARSAFVAGVRDRSAPPGPVDALVLNDCGTNFVADLGHPLEARPHYDLACAAMRPAAWSQVLIVRRAGAPVRPRAQGRVQLASTPQGGALASAAAPGAAAELHDLSVHAYYVGEAPASDGERRFELRRQTLVGGPSGRPRIVDEPLVAGVADLRVLLGVDLDGDDSADAFVPPGSPELARGRIVAVRLSLTALASAPPGAAAIVARDGPPPDGRERVVLERTVALRNAAGR